MPSIQLSLGRCGNVALACCGITWSGISADLSPAPQHFRQEVARQFVDKAGLPPEPAQLLDCGAGRGTRSFVGGHWYDFHEDRWVRDPAISGEDGFNFYDAAERPVHLKNSWRRIRQIVHGKTISIVATDSELIRVHDQKPVRLDWPATRTIHQIALDSKGGLHVASSAGLFCEQGQVWQRIEVIDEGGREWAARDVLGVGFDSKERLWFATKAGVGCRDLKGWRFYEGKDGLPWNDFTGIACGPGEEVWFATHLGVLRFDGTDWHYRQGPLWLSNDDVAQVAVDARGTAWLATSKGVSSLERIPMTLAQKAEQYEGEIEKYIKRTPLGYVAEARLRLPADKASADPQDSDNDGLWTAMYGAGECLGYAATGEARTKSRAKQAFEALRLLQKVTQDCPHAPPKGYVARTIRPSEWPDPNIGRLQSDLQEQQHDKLWKAYEPRWPKSADGKWFWKSDTSSDELDGHFFFYPLYYDLCADSKEERERVREVVQELIDHLIAHDFCLIDHDGKPTRWGVYGPQFLNEDPTWWPERGLKSLSMLCYLAVAAHVTGDRKYEEISRQLIERHGYAQNAMFPKVHQGAGSGNQSDDEMAFMCYYGLLRCSRDDKLKAQIRYSFFRSWVNEAPEMNPFFNIAYAAHNAEATATTPWGTVSLRPGKDWLSDAMTTLQGFPLERLNWPHRNSHRLDVVALPSVRSSDLDMPDAPRHRGHRINGKVLPVENRHFNHWNTDPWQLDYGGNGGELAAGTVFLLPYYMGLYHGFIEKPAK